ncbi:hypothetical protein A5848_000957, partial [Enterococcus faecium]
MWSDYLYSAISFTHDTQLRII